MDILNSVLEHCKPLEWECASYSSKTYHLFDLTPGDDEYIEEISPFLKGYPRLTVRTLKRYQNPFLLGRFKVRKEQLKFRGERVNEIKYYHAVSKTDLTTALEYNMDVRRYNNKYCCCRESKNPKFYQTPGGAYSACSGATDIAILVCKVLGKDTETSTYKINDAEYMPIYVVEL